MRQARSRCTGGIASNRDPSFVLISVLDSIAPVQVWVALWQTSHEADYPPDRSPPMRMLVLLLVLAHFTPWNSSSANAQFKDVISEEAKTPRYVLPDPLLMADGTKVADADTWRTKRRPELLYLFEEHVYGRSPKPAGKVQFEITSADAQALEGKATRKQIAIFIAGKRDGPRMDLPVYVPNGVSTPVPAFLGLNFYGNQCIDVDPGITLSTRWMTPNKAMGVVNNRATEASRGCHAHRWQVEMVLARGYALATACYGDLEPDWKEGWKTGLRAQLSPDGDRTMFKLDDWGAIGAWTFGLSRAGLPGTGRSDRRQPRCPDRSFPAGKNRALGRCPGRAVRLGHFERFGQGGCRARTAAVRRTDSPLARHVSLLVLRPLFPVRRERK